MMKSALSALFNPPETSSKTATITRQISATRFEVVDDAGRKALVDTDIVLLSPGLRVIIQAGRIIAMAGRVENIKTYEV